MAEQLGKVEKPEAERFTSQRKLYIISLVFCEKESPPEYVEKFNLYWEQVNEQVANLESKIGKVNHVFHESIASSDEDGINAMEKLNPPGCQSAKDKCQRYRSVQRDSTSLWRNSPLDKKPRGRATRKLMYARLWVSLPGTQDKFLTDMS